MSVFIIAEVGVNHNGSMKIAKQLIDVAAISGADAVKFQTFNADRQVTQTAKKARYQEVTTQKSETHYDMLRKLELSEEMHVELMAYCHKKNILFLSSPFDIESVDLLANLGQKCFKVPSGEITNLPYLRHIGRLNNKVILSTGMSNLLEIKAAINIIESAGTSRDKITTLHCTSEYPLPMSEVNLLAMNSMREEFKTNIGYSDHTVGIEVAIAAAAMGASIIEKHFTVNKDLPGPDHKASLNPAELKLMVKSIRNIERALGDGIKKLSACEIDNMWLVRKSIVAKKEIRVGESFTNENIIAKRPGNGISPMFWDDLIGKKAKKSYSIDELIEK